MLLLLLFLLKLLDLRSNEGLRDVYQEPLLQFYSQLQKERYPVLLKNASTYRCEQEFSDLKLNKSKLRSQLTDGHLDAIMRIAITPLKPNFATFDSEKMLAKK